MDCVTVSNEKKMSDILSLQYERVCSVPRDEISNPGFMEELLRKDVDFETEARLESLVFMEEETKKILSKVSNGAAVGPDGVPTQCYKYGGGLVVTALTDIASQSLDQNEIPQILKLGWVTPI